MYIKNNKKKSSKLILNLVASISIIIIIYNILSTYAYFTNEINIDNGIQLGDISAEIQVDGSSSMQVNISNLMYLNDSTEDFNKLDEFGVTIILKITNTSELNQRINISFSEQTLGLFYLITDVNENNIGNCIISSTGNNTQEKITNYNNTYLSNLINSVTLSPGESIERKIVFFAIYDYLSLQDKLIYDTLTFKISLAIQCSQN